MLFRSILESEVNTYSSSLSKKQRLIIGTKIDIDTARDNLDIFKSKNEEENITGISSITGEGLDTLKKTIVKYVMREVQA